MAITWLHISDLHLKPVQENPNYIDQQSWNSKSLRKFIKKQREREQDAWKPNMIFVTGDITDKADMRVFKTSDGREALATRFFDALLKDADLGREHLFIVPGNHDVDRKALNKWEDFSLTSDDAESYFHNMEPKIHIEKKQKAFADWYDVYFRSARSFPRNKTCDLHEVNINGHDIAIILMNSALFCKDEHDQNRLWLGRGSVHAVLDGLREDGKPKPELTIALVHHPLDWLHRHERSTIISDFKKPIFSQRRNILAYGHKHTTEADDSEIFTLGAGAVGKSENPERRALYARFDSGSVTVFPIFNTKAPHWQWSADTSVFPEDLVNRKCFDLNQHNPSSPLIQTHDAECERYMQQLKTEVDHTKLLGAPRHAQRQALNLEETFIPLHIEWQKDKASEHGRSSGTSADGHLLPEELMKRAFGNKAATYRLLLVFGDAGTGKTTLMQYYALSILHETRWRSFGFERQPRVFFLRLRDIYKTESEYSGQKAESSPQGRQLPPTLSDALYRKTPSIAQTVFEEWLRSSRPSLVLLDGLDEVINISDRTAVCAWIDSQHKTYEWARLVVTTRRSGYSQGNRLEHKESVEFASPYYFASVSDLDAQQQRQFLVHWHRTVSKLNQPYDYPESEEEISRQAEQFADQIMMLLADDKYRQVRRLVSVPMVLQMLAFLLKEKSDGGVVHLIPETREQLYRELFDYLVMRRDEARGILVSGTQILNMNPDDFREVLGPVALSMLEQQNNETPLSDDGHFPLQVSKEKLYDILSEKLGALVRTNLKLPAVEEVYNHIVKRAELLETTGPDDNIYQFRHKSFAEYLAGVELRQATDGFRMVIGKFDDPSWEEIIRFFLVGADKKIFDSFMDCLFNPSEKDKFSQTEKNLFLSLLSEASKTRMKSDALCRRLRELPSELSDSKERQIMLIDALGVIGDPPALTCLEEFRLQRTSESEPQKPDQIASRVGTVLSELNVPQNQWIPPVVREGGETILRLPFEYNAEYLLILGIESFRYSRSKKPVKVDDRYFARYPVTNRRFRRFIDYLSGKDKEFAERLPVKSFTKHLKMIAESKAWDGKYWFADYLKETAELAERFRSKFDDDRKFGGDDQPVVGVSWYNARAYCLWLSLVESGGEHDDLYRLPVEAEWAWAAGGGTRKYPWGDPDPDETRANYGGNVGATTPVGIYPAGATPEGLYDMAGNVWEWQENRTDKDKVVRALRGGSWFSGSGNLRCDERSYDLPDLRNILFGFRVVRPSPF